MALPKMFTKRNEVGKRKSGGESAKPKATPKTTKPAPKKEAIPAVVEPAKKESGKQMPMGTFIAIERQHLSEKASRLAEEGQYVFRIADGASKAEVRGAVERLYSVHVESIGIIRMPAREIGRGRRKGTRSGYKKAIVRLKKGDRIDLTV